MIQPNSILWPTPQSNGHIAPPPEQPQPQQQGVSREQLEELLTRGPLTQGYKPTLPIWALWSWSTDWIPQLYILRDIELMLIHPMIQSVLNFYKSGIHQAEFWGGPDPQNPDPLGPGLPVSDNPEVADFVLKQVQRFWDRGVPKVQMGYDFGWIGCENLYVCPDGDKQGQGRMEWDDLIHFSPRDTFLLTQSHSPVGVRVKNVAEKGEVDLFMASKDVPAKALWYAHRPRYQSFYGQSQLLGAWRPWRRLAWKDGAETVVDTGVYRFAYCGPVVKYPEEDLQTAQSGVPGTTLNSQGNPMRYARDMARFIAEQMKAGAGIGLPSTSYPTDQGGGPKWGFEIPQTTLNEDGLINYLKYLHDLICHGIGVPPELLSSSETGSGYSGRAIPLETFIVQQQQLADAILLLFIKQVLAPLVRWNYGAVKWHVEVKSLLKLHRAGQQPGGRTPAGIGQQQNLVGGPSKDANAGDWVGYTTETGHPAWYSQSKQEHRYQQERPGAAQSPQRAGVGPAGGFSLTNVPDEVAAKVVAIARKIAGMRAAA